MLAPAQPTPDPGFATFGELIRYLRHRARLTQRELSIAVGYSEAQISRLEGGYRPPDPATMAARFVPALHLEDEPELAARLLALARAARGEPPDGQRAADTEVAAARPSPVPSHSGSLPRPLTSFVGREQALSDLRGLLAAEPAGPRLITLAGPGGCGKTRLALHVAQAQAGSYPDGAWWVELAPVSDPGGVVQAAALALGLDGEFAAGSANRLCASLQTRHLLLVLDNAEHVADAAAELAAAILQRCPSVHILATSREALSLAGEAVYGVPPLSLPPHPLAGPSPESLGQSEAVQLFIARAKAALPAFELTPANAAAVARVCRQLDGLPLAIELAAARVPMLRVEDIAARLHDSHALLRSQQRGGPARHQTLWGALEWSYQLLPAAEAALLRRLAAFAGSWTLEASAAVADSLSGTTIDGTSGPTEILDLLAHLARKSLVVLERQPEAPARYRLLETMRQFADEKLTEAGEAHAASASHLDYYVRLAERAEPALRGHGQTGWLRRLDLEHDNLRAALAWAVERQQGDAALRLAGALYEFWHIRGYYQEGCHWLSAALGLPGSLAETAHQGWRAKALLGYGALTAWRGDLAGAQARLEESAALYRGLRDNASLGHVHYWLAAIPYFRGDLGASRALYEESLALCTAAEDAWGIGNAVHCLGHVVDRLGDHAAALKHFEQAVAILRETGDRWNITHPLDDLAWQVWFEGDARRARSLLEDNLRAFSDLGGRRGMAMTLEYLCTITLAQGDTARAQALADEQSALRSALGVEVEIAVARVIQGDVAYAQGALAEATAHFEAAQRMFAGVDDQNGVAWAKTKHAIVLFRRGSLAPAQALLEASLAVLEQTQFPLDLALASYGLAQVAWAQGRLEQAADLYHRGLKITIEHGGLPHLAEPLEGLAKVAQAGGQPERAAKLFGAAAALRERMETPALPVERADLDAHVSACAAALGRTAFEAAWQAGFAHGRDRAAALTDSAALLAALEVGTA